MVTTDLGMVEDVVITSHSRVTMEIKVQMVTKVDTILDETEENISASTAINMATLQRSVEGQNERRSQQMKQQICQRRLRMNQHCFYQIVKRSDKN